MQPDGEEEEDERANEALEDVRRLITELDPSIDIDLVELPFDNFHAALLRCTQVLEAADGDVIVVLGGGARDIFLPLSYATLTQHSTVDTVLQFSDITGEVSELRLPNLHANLTESQLETLSELSEADSPLTLSELETTVGHSKSTITRHVSELEEAGLVRTTFEGRSKVIELKSTGKLYLAAHNPE